MSETKQTHYKSPEEYLVMEESAVYKSEYLDGEVLAMSGGTIEHSSIILNTGAALKQALKGTLCRVFESNLKIGIKASNSYLYPDTTVICGNPVRDEKSNHAITNPMLIVEVLSESTGAYDRGEKFHKYQKIATFREYMLIEQKAPQVDIFSKNTEGKWMVESYFGLDAVVELRSLNVKIPMAGIYEWVEFGGE